MKKKTLTLLLLKFLKIGSTIFNLTLVAKYFGVSMERDSWLLAFNAIMIFDLAIWGPINETFRTKFIFLREEKGEHEALNSTKSLLLFIFLISTILVASVMFFPEIPAKLIAPSFQNQKLVLLLKMLVYIAPCFLINQFIQIGASILNAYESYYIPEISGFVSTILSIILLIVFAPYIGIYALFISHYLAMIVLISMIIYQIKKLDIKIFSGYNSIKFSDFKIFFIFALPFFLPYFVGQLSSVFEKSIASSLGSGIVSTIDYSKKFYEILIGVLTSVLTTLLIPTLSLKFAQKKDKEFVNEFLHIYQLGFLVITLMIAMFTVCPRAFIEILYQSKLLAENDLENISKLATAFSWATLGVFFYLTFGMVLLSSNKGKIYAISGLVAQVLNILCYFLFTKYLSVYVFPISLFVSHFLCGLFMFSNFPVDASKVKIITLKYLGILFFAISSLYIINVYLYDIKNPYFEIIVNLIMLSFILVTLIFIFRLEESKWLIKKYKNFNGLN